MTPEELAHLEAQLGLAHDMDGRAPAADARTSMAQAMNAKPVDLRHEARQARAFVTRGDAIGAAKHLTAEMADGDPELLLTIGEIQLRGGHLQRGTELVERALAQNLSLADDVVRIGIELADRQPDAGFVLVEMAADTWAIQTEWPKAAAAFQQFISLQPDYVPAHIRLREMQMHR
jgi:hypothetical protein